MCRRLFVFFVVVTKLLGLRFYSDLAIDLLGHPNIPWLNISASAVSNNTRSNVCPWLLDGPSAQRLVSARYPTILLWSRRTSHPQRLPCESSHAALRSPCTTAPARDSGSQSPNGWFATPRWNQEVVDAQNEVHAAIFVYLPADILGTTWKNKHFFRNKP
jgi:hypothetical protein